MAMDLNTILNDAGNRALTEEYLSRTLLERLDFDTVLANSDSAQEFKIPEGEGQRVKMTRKGRFRMPQKLPNATPTSDPASGATMAVDQIVLPIEYLHEYVEIATTAQLTSWLDLMGWAKEDLPMALKRRFHQLTQNAFVAGRFQPGLWAADGTATTAFDTTQELTPTLDGVSYTFVAAPRQYPGGKTAFNTLTPEDRASFADLERVRVGLSLAGAPKFPGGFYRCVLSDSMSSDLQKEDKYFQAMVQAFKGEGLRQGTIARYKGWEFLIDDEPYTLEWATDLVRATDGPVHAACCFGRHAFAYLNLGGKRTPRPTFKVQDISKTGVSKTVGYMVPFQAAIANAAWCNCFVAPVSDSTPNA